MDISYKSGKNHCTSYNIWVQYFESMSVKLLQWVKYELIDNKQEFIKKKWKYLN